MNPSREAPVGIAVVEHDRHVLVGTRAEGTPLAGLAEFPGGKCEAGESPCDCALRECLEETGLEVEPVERLLRQTFAYPHGAVDLHFWLCRPVNPERPKLSGGFRWVTVHELGSLAFPEANTAVLEMLAERFA